MKQVTVLVFLTLFFTFVNIVSIHAQEVSISLSPAVQEIVAKPGQSISLEFILTNLGDPQQISLKAVTLKPQPDGTFKITNKLEGPLQADLTNQDISLAEPFFLKNKEKRVVRMAVQIPQTLQEKDYYIGLVAQSQAPPTNEGTVTVRAQLGVVANIAVSITSDGSLETKPKVITFQINSNNKLNLLGRKYAVVLGGKPSALLMELSNQGRHLIHAQGTVSVNGLGPKKNLVIVPRTIPAYSQVSLSTVNQPGFFFGPYTVSATVNFGPSSPVVYATTYVLALPGLLVFLIGCLLIVLVSVKIFRK